jgi:putative membrane protein insertion efficiency factor
MRILFRFYRVVLSPLLHSFSKFLGGNPYSGCKFIPTCSEYCEEAMRKHGLWRGSWKGILRICRCHPFSGPGGHDPV